MQPTGEVIHNRYLTIIKHSKGTFFRNIETKYMFYVTKQKLEKAIQGNVTYNNLKTF